MRIQRFITFALCSLLSFGCIPKKAGAVIKAILPGTPSTPGIEIKAVTGLLTSESGASAQFSVRLLSKPKSDVLIPNISTSNSKEGVSNVSSLTFTPSDWDQKKTITVTGVDDAFEDGSQKYSLNFGRSESSDLDYSSIALNSFEIINADNDTSGITVSAPSPAFTTESGGTSIISVVLNTLPSDSVTVSGITSSNILEGTVNISSLNFNASDWNVPQNITVTGIDDASADGSVSYTVNFGSVTSNDPKYSGLSLTPVQMYNSDNEPAGVTASISTASILEGNSQNFTVVLTYPPAGSMTVALTSSSSRITLSSNLLTFTFANWNTPQTVTMNTVDDLSVQATETVLISVGPTTNYAGVDPADITVTLTDNDSAGFTITPISGNTTESGGTATFTVRLNSLPSASVTVPLSSSNTSEGTVSPASLTFTTLNWSTPQTVTVTGADDFIADGTIAYSVILSAAASADLNYSGLNPPDVSLSNTDNDVAGNTVNTVNSITTDGGQISASYTMKLNTFPTANVTFNLSSSDTSEGTVSPSSLTFTPANWNTLQTITVNGVFDGINDGNKSLTLIISPAVSADPNYNGMDPADKTIQSCDNDAPGAKVSFCRASNSFFTTEAGGTAVFYLIGSQSPTANATFNVTSSNTAEGTVSPASITLNSGNWNTFGVSNKVTITGVDDALYDLNQNYQINFGSITSTDLFYSGYTPVSVPLYNQDNEPAFIITGISGNTNESGTTATFTVRLGNRAPTGNVTINVSSSNTAEGTVSPSVLTFTSGNYSTPQTVTVTGVNDSLLDGDKNYTIILASAVSADSAYNGMNPNDVSLQNIDNDKRIFLTSGTFNGALFGAAGADTLCSIDSNYPGSGTFKAMLTQGTVRRASVSANAGDSQVDWVLKPNYEYITTGGNPLFNSNANSLFVFGTLTNVLGSGNVWTGLNANWTNAAQHCSNWTSSSNGVSGNTGDSSALNSSFNSFGTDTCDTLKHLYCVEQ